MKKIAAAFHSAFFLFVFFQLVSCQKIIDHYFPNHPEQPDEVEFQDTVSCDMSGIDVWTFYNDGTETTERGLLFYDAMRKPDSIIFLNNSGSNFPGYHFHYDDMSRLKEFEITFPGTGELLLRHLYGYKNKTTKRVYSDTLSVYYTNPKYTIISILEYDQKGRVSKEVKIKGDTISSESYPSLEPVVYDYDIENNLVVQLDQVALDVYDEKINFLRTNRLWMFLDRNYSLNNIRGTQIFNSQGLVTDFNKRGPLFLSSLELAKIIYQCP